MNSVPQLSRRVKPFRSQFSRRSIRVARGPKHKKARCLKKAARFIVLSLFRQIAKQQHHTTGGPTDARIILHT